MYSTCKQIVNDEGGATAIEFGLIAAVISVAAVSALVDIGDLLKAMFNLVNDALNVAIGN